MIWPFSRFVTNKEFQAHHAIAWSVNNAINDKLDELQSQVDELNLFIKTTYKAKEMPKAWRDTVNEMMNQKPDLSTIIKKANKSVVKKKVGKK